MRNYIQPGHAITLLAPYDVVSGGGLLVGSIFGVASHDALSGAEVETQLTGVIDLAKVASQAWTAGAKVYWDNTAKRVTTRDAEDRSDQEPVTGDDVVWSQEREHVAGLDVVPHRRRSFR